MTESRPLRIACPVTWDTPDRRADREQTMQTVAALGRRGHHVSVIVPGGEASGPALAHYFGVEPSFSVLSVPSPPVGDSLVKGLSWLARLYRSGQLSRYDLLFARMPALLGIGRFSPIPFMFDHYRPWPEEYPLARRIIRANCMSQMCVGLALHSRLAAESYIATGIDPDRILVAHNGGDTELPGTRPDQQTARAALGIGQDAPLVVYAGRVNEKKGLDQVLALAEARPHIRFLLVGSEGEGPIEAAARRSPNVAVVGFQPKPRLWTYLAAADILLIPPSSEPLRRFGNCVLPLKTFTYLSAGRAILAPALPDTADILEHGRNAWLIPPDDLPGAAAALDWLLGDGALMDRLAQGAQSDASGFSWESRAAKISEFAQRRLSEALAARRA